MKELISELNESLHYEEYEIQGEELLIHVSSLWKMASCPYCGQPSWQIHSHKVRTLKDLPIQSKKVKLLLDLKKYFCKNKECTKTTFAERFDFFCTKSNKNLAAAGGNTACGSDTKFCNVIQLFAK